MVPPPPTASGRRRRRGAIAALGAAVLAAAPASAQLLGQPLPQPFGPGLGQTLGGALDLPGRTLGTAPSDLIGQTTGALRDPAELAKARVRRLRALVRAHPHVLELDEHGFAAVRGEVLAVSPSDASLRIASQAGFAVAAEDQLAPLGLTLVTFQAPPGLSARQALKRLRKLDPSGAYDYDHLYSGAGEATAGAAGGRDGGASRGAPRPQGARLGLIDTGVDADQGALDGVRIVQRGFAPGGPAPAAHGTAVASLMAGDQGRFHGADPGAPLYVADVYGTGPAGGAAAAIVRALAWLTGAGVQVINISLVGPPNGALDAAVRAVLAKGVVLVAAVGNDGPAAPPMYPASYPGVVAVSGVDARGRPLIEAGRASHLDFCAPGADMAAARLGGGFGPVRGTSFAAPIVAGELGRRVHGDGTGAAQAALAQLSRAAVDPEPKTRPPVCGRGLVGEDVRTAPGAVGARGAPIT